MKKIILAIAILSILAVIILNHLKGKNVDMVCQHHSKTIEEINSNQPEIIPYLPFLIKL
jgi:hypothetical protein